MKQTLLWISAVFYIISAALWLYGAAQTVTFDPEERDEDGTHPAAMTVRSKKGRQIDVLKTAARQTRWNRWAAVAAALAALTNAWALRIA